MKIADIIVGSEYKVKAANSSGNYVVLDIKEKSKGKYDIICRNPKEAFPRTFRPEQLLEQAEAKSKSKAQKIQSSVAEVVGDFGQFTMNVEDVTFWPNYGERGRPRKNG